MNTAGGLRDRALNHDRSGVALITVIVVLLALVIIATPFSISMRNYSESSTDLLHRTHAARECETLRNVALERIKESHPALDHVTPYHDTEDEWKVKLDELPFDFDVNDPLGRIWSLRTADLQGRININGASVYLLANILDQRTRLVEPPDEGMGLTVGSTRNFPEAGFLWVDGEGMFYGGISGDVFRDLDRELALPSMEWNPMQNHAVGTEVIGFTAFLIATHCYKSNPGYITSFPTVESVRNIAVYGESTLTRDRFDRIEDFITAHSAFPEGRRFVNSQRVLFLGEDEASDTVVVENGRYIGAGSIVRIRVGDRTHQSLVLGARNSGTKAWSILLQEALPFGVEAGEFGVIETLARPAVNVNTASEKVLEALVLGLSLTDAGEEWLKSLHLGWGERRGLNGDALAKAALEGGGGLAEVLSAPSGMDLGMGSSLVGPKEAAAVAKELAAGAPVTSFVDLADRLDALIYGESAVLNAKQRWAILLNGFNANDAFVHGGTAPFCFESGGCFRIDSAVSDNYPGSGREKARRFNRDIAWVAPSEPSLHVFSSQRDFEDQKRLTREGRGYVSFPANLNRPSLFNDPPSLAPAICGGGFVPSESVDEGGIQLKPVRIEGERVIHFDETDLPFFKKGHFSLVPTRSEEGPAAAFAEALGFATGELMLYADPAQMPVALLDGPYGRIFPFSIELWYRFDDLDQQHLIFDCGEEGREVNNRIYLYHDGKELIFRVADSTLPTASINSDEPIEYTEIRYDFSDLPLEEGVFYHFACMVGGSKPSDIALFVDGVPRGKRSFLTRLREPLTAGSSGTGIETLVARSTIKVLDSSRFPRRGVLRIGGELIEYVSNVKNEFIADTQENDPFGGRSRRGSRGTDHEETECVELYGYTSRLHSDTIPNGDVELGDQLGPFRVAMVDHNGSGYEPQEVYLAGPNDTYSPFNIGRGIFTESNMSALPVKDLDGTPLSDQGDGIFSSSGGYAIMFSEFPSDFEVTFTGAGGTKHVLNVKKQNGDMNRPLTGKPKPDFLANGYTVFRYNSFTGSSLTGITWGVNGGFPSGQPLALLEETSEESSGDSGDNSEVGSYNFLIERCFITEYNNGIFTNQEEAVTQARVFILPISIKLNNSAENLYEDFYTALSEVAMSGLGDGEKVSYKPELVQIGLDFNESGEDETEWIRYNSIENDLFLRDDPDIITNTWNFLSTTGRINVETDIDPNDVSTAVNRLLRFRGQHGTRNGGHSSGSRVLPVFRTFVTEEARPGRHDAVTLINPDPTTEPEAAMINFCNCYGSTDGSPYTDHDYGSNVALIGLRAGVSGEYKRQDFDLTGIRESVRSGQITAEQLSTTFSIESRDYTRIIKFPSGELPSKIPESFVLGGSISGDISPGKGMVDEVRFRSFDTPNAEFTEGSGPRDQALAEGVDEDSSVKLPTLSRFMVKEELEVEEDDQLELHTDALKYNRGVMRHSLLEAYEILRSLPEDAGFLLIGDEIIAYTDVDWEEGILTLAPEGRGLFGTEPGYHERGEAVHLINFPRVSVLQGTLSERDAAVFLQETEGFPFEGAVLVDQEVIAYTRNEQGALFMPEGEVGDDRSKGLLRGRYGTRAVRHPAGSLVYHLPVRYRDLYMPGTDEPEGAWFPLSLHAPGGFYNRLTWIEEKQGPGTDFVVQARVGGRGGWEMLPGESPDVLLFEKSGASTRRNHIRRQGDRLDLRIYTRFGEGAFDPLDFSSNAWKYAPRLKTLGVEYVQPTRIVRHEEWR